MKILDDCYICGQYGHIQYNCPMKQGDSKSASHGRVHADFKNNREKNHPMSSSISSIKINLNETDRNQIQQIYNQSSKLVESSQSIDQRNKTFDLFLSLIKKLQEKHGENLSKVFREKESIFYSLFCHVAQNHFLFTCDQYSRLYAFKSILLPQKQHLLNEDRLIFSCQRTLMPLNIITKHIKTVKQFRQSIFNDFQEHIIRSTSPISRDLFDLIKYLFQSHIHIDKNCFEYFTKTILFDRKKDIFSTEQLNELHSYSDIRMKRLECKYQKQLWQERLLLFKNDNISVDLTEWISEFEQILMVNHTERRKSETMIVDHAMWYFAVLLMASSGHLNKQQYDYLLKLAIQSSLFNLKQKFYFQFYLKQGQAPVTKWELNEIKIKLESHKIDDKNFAFEQIKAILDRAKPGFSNEQVSQTSFILSDL